jgi:hypothetical protein
VGSISRIHYGTVGEAGRSIVPNDGTGTRRVELVEPESAVVDEGGSSGAY